MKRICVYCGSSPGADQEYKAEAQHLGRLLVEKNIELVYGGAHIGLMGALADSALEAGGCVTGVMPRFLVEKEVAHTGLSELKTVESMHERKLLMADLADAFVALPGGLGTLDEFFEVLTWGQLGLHRKPCGLLNTRQYFKGLLAFLDHLERERFLSRQHRETIIVAAQPGVLLQKLASHQPVDVEKWLDRKNA